MNKVRDGCIKANSWQNNEEKMRLGTRSTKGLKKAYDRQETRGGTYEALNLYLQ